MENFSISLEKLGHREMFLIGNLLNHLSDMDFDPESLEIVFNPYMANVYLIDNESGRVFLWNNEESKLEYA